jgi:hypothetical protein
MRRPRDEQQSFFFLRKAANSATAGEYALFLSVKSRRLTTVTGSEAAAALGSV